MASWWYWDTSRKINGADWNNAREAVLDVTTGHDHDNSNSKGVPKKVDTLPEATTERIGTIVFLTTDEHMYICI